MSYKFGINNQMKLKEKQVTVELRDKNDNRSEIKSFEKQNACM